MMIVAVPLLVCGWMAAYSYHPLRECRKADTTMSKRDVFVTKYSCYENDSLEWIQRLKNGKSHGLSETFYPSGKKAQEKPYLNGKLNGVHKGWMEDGFQAFSKPYKNDLPIGTQESWYAPGKPEQILHYNAKGEKDGVQKQWWKNGNMEYDLVSKQGRIISGTEFYPDGKPRIRYVYDFDPKRKTAHEYNKVVETETWSPSGKSISRIVKGNGESITFLAQPDSVSKQYVVFDEFYQDGELVKGHRLDSASVAKLLQ
jgi:antitoxin component YwqK of YwqJK toxin-antitoxin module